MANLSSKAFLLFKQYIYNQCGIDIKEDKAYLIETRLSKLLIDSGLSSFEEFYYVLKNNRDTHVATKVIDAITTNETLWFRDKTPWLILEELLLPRFIDELRAGKKTKIRIWSAAASTGQEAYSIVMCIDYYLKRNGINDIKLSDFEVVATDISTNVLEIAKRGHYDSISIMRGMEEHYKERYFKKVGLIWELDENIKKHVRFEQFNLQSSFMFMGKYDCIFCRYVLIYFSDVLKHEIIEKMARKIENKGVFIIGASEIYHSMDGIFSMQHHKDGTYYLLKGDQG